eukprot:scaffold16043_cov115-Isochrysis_galbana.AAC.13
MMTVTGRRAVEIARPALERTERCRKSRANHTSPRAGCVLMQSGPFLPPPVAVNGTVHASDALVFYNTWSPDHVRQRSKQRATRACLGL